MSDHAPAHPHPRSRSIGYRIEDPAGALDTARAGARPVVQRAAGGEDEGVEGCDGGGGGRAGGGGGEGPSVTTPLDAYPMDLRGCVVFSSACSLLRADIRDPRGMAPRVAVFANAIARMFQSERFTTEQIVEETQYWPQYVQVSPEHGMPYAIEEACLFWPIYYDAFQAVSDATAEERVAAEEIRVTLAALLIQPRAQKMLGSRYEMRRFVELMRGREVPDLEVPRVAVASVRQEEPPQ